MSHPALAEPSVPELYRFSCRSEPALLEPRDGAAFSFLQIAGRASAVLICDHASNAMPAALNRLGLDRAELARHIAWDIGVEEVARELAPRLDCPTVLSGFSRLVIDANRRLGSTGAIPAASDGTEVPGNRNLGPPHRAARVEQLFKPYHAAVSRVIEAKLAEKQQPVLIFLHSFTPVMQGFHRPWEIGVLWSSDGRIAKPLIEGLRAKGLAVGDNEPYSGASTEDYGLHVHGEGRGLPCVLIELRQDLVDTHQGALRWAKILHEVLTPLLARQHP